MTAHGVTFDAFLERLATDFEWSGVALGPDSRLIEDCGLDSMGMYELLLFLEELGYEIDEDAMFEWETLADVFRLVSHA